MCMHAQLIKGTFFLLFFLAIGADPTAVQFSHHHHHHYHLFIMGESPVESSTSSPANEIKNSRPPAGCSGFSACSSGTQTCIIVADGGVNKLFGWMAVCLPHSVLRWLLQIRD